MNNLIAEKTFIVAGGGGLLGAKLIYGAMKQGAKVIAADVDVISMKDRLIQQGVDVESDMISLRSLDITDNNSVKCFFSELNGIVDGAVNATYPRSSSYGRNFFDVSFDSFNDNVSLHLGSAFLFTQQAALYFKKINKSFSLVNISSVYGVIAPKFDVYQNTNMTMPVEYAAIKAAIQHLNKYVVAYVNDSKFRVNSVSPGGILDGQADEFLAAYKANTHGTGMLTANDIVGSVLFLLSEQSKYITGQNLIVDDGFSL